MTTSNNDTRSVETLRPELRRVISAIDIPNAEVARVLDSYRAVLAANDPRSAQQFEQRRRERAGAMTATCTAAMSIAALAGILADDRDYNEIFDFMFGPHPGRLREDPLVAGLILHAFGDEAAHGTGGEKFGRRRAAAERLSSG